MNSKGGGISVYIRDSVKFKERKDVPMNDLDLVCLEVELMKS